MIFKKLLLSLFLVGITSTSFAKERVVSMWPFTPASTQGNYYRAILEQANKEQTKYEFVFENKTGAGGAIATADVLNRSGTRILAHSAAFFVRPYLYPDTPYKFEQFKPLMIMGFSPAALITKNKSLDQLLSQNKLNIGTAGAGSSIHLLAEAFFKPYKNSKDIQMIHYRDTNEPAKEIIGGHLDASFEFLGDAKGRGDMIRIIGLTGRRSIDGIPTLKGMEDLVGIFAIYVPKDMPDAQVTELQQILLRAEKHESVQMLYRKDFTSKDPQFMLPGDYSNWYNKTIKQFEEYTRGIKVQ